MHIFPSLAADNIQKLPETYPPGKPRNCACWSASKIQRSDTVEWFDWLCSPWRRDCRILFLHLLDVFFFLDNYFLMSHVLFVVMYYRRSLAYIQIILTYLWTQRTDFLSLPLSLKQIMWQRSRTSFLLTNLHRRIKKKLRSLLKIQE